VLSQASTSKKCFLDVYKTLYLPLFVGWYEFCSRISSSFMSLVISAFAFCTASSLALSIAK
jgi:hypothetical protein